MELIFRIWLLWALQARALGRETVYRAFLLAQCGCCARKTTLPGSSYEYKHGSSFSLLGAVAEKRAAVACYLHFQECTVYTITQYIQLHSISSTRSLRNFLRGEQPEAAATRGDRGWLKCSRTRRQRRFVRLLPNVSHCERSSLEDNA